MPICDTITIKEQKNKNAPKEISLMEIVHLAFPQLLMFPVVQYHSYTPS